MWLDSSTWGKREVRKVILLAGNWHPKVKQFPRAAVVAQGVSFQCTILHPLPKVSHAVEGLLFLQMVYREDFICFRHSTALTWCLLSPYWEVCSKAFLVHWNRAGHKADKISVLYYWPRADRCMPSIVLKLTIKSGNYAGPAQFPVGRKEDERDTKSGWERFQICQRGKDWLSGMFRSPKTEDCTHTIAVFQHDPEESHFLTFNCMNRK